MIVQVEYEAARGYADRGWSILRMNMAKKIAKGRWKRYQRHRAADSTIYNWFRKTDHGVGVIFGTVSGGLASRDFDDRDSYQGWANLKPTLAAELPTVVTRRGFHVYCNAWPESVVEARRRLGKPEDAHGAIGFDDGELRAGVGCYSVVPPSTHPTGHVYGWSNPLPAGDLPTIDICDSGFIDFSSRDSTFISCYREYGENREYRGYGSNEVEEMEEARDETRLVESVTAEDAIASALPTRPGQRHRQVFELARGLKAVSALTDSEPRDLRVFVEAWHKRSLPHISTKPFEETWIDFIKAWPNVRFPKGSEPMAIVFERACSDGLPDAAERYEQSALQLLVAICRELQRAAGDGPFYLACRTAGQLVEVDHVTANRWLFLLVADDVLELVERGGRSTRRASRYRYRGDL